VSSSVSLLFTQSFLTGCWFEPNYYLTTFFLIFFCIQIDQLYTDSKWLPLYNNKSEGGFTSNFFETLMYRWFDAAYQNFINAEIFLVKP
jgi:hypothetical protein